jgi:ubiquinol-cytochrome c reductase cytochrome c subunit
MTMRVLIASLAVACGLVGVATGAEPPPGDEARGRQLYQAVGCYQCHGRVGQGSIQSGPKLAPQPLPLEALVAVLREPINVMPAYSVKALSDRDIADIHAYLSAVPMPPPLKDLPLLSN